MQSSIKKIFLILLVIYSGSIAKAQNGNFNITATVGLANPILDNGIGYHFGINPSKIIGNYFAIEGQVSYLYTDVNGSFLSGDTKSSNSVNALVGGRLYFNARDKRIRPFINLLIGGNYLVEQRQGREKESNFGLGLSGGAFLEVNRLLFGLAYEAPGSVVLKVGYTF